MLRLPPFRYIAPRHLDEAAHLLAQEGEQAVRLLADAGSLRVAEHVESHTAAPGPRRAAGFTPAV